MAIEPKNADLLDRGHEKTTVVNCIGASPTRLAREFDARSRERLLAVTDARGSEAFGYLAPVVTLPNSYGLLKHTFLLAARQSPDARASANDEMPALNHNGLNCRKCPSRVRNGMSERIVAEHKGPGEIF
jgi:hypothetical protein